MHATSFSSTPLASEVAMSTIQDTDVSALKKEIELLKAKKHYRTKKLGN